MLNARWMALLLLGSGFTSLAYQSAWFRSFRLVFGATTSATAAVLAVFMGGLGVGGLWLGPRADRHPNPLALYARLELGVALCAGLSPALLWLVDAAYVASGGAATLGMGVATVLRILGAVLVMGPAAVLMGATLPAASRVVTASVPSRSGVALLYGVNTLGAVLGVGITTFVMLPELGNRATLLLAVGVNLAVVMVAQRLSTSAESAPLPAPAMDAAPPDVRGEATRRLPPALVLTAAWGSGFAFLCMELVWNRMLAPLLGGSVLGFGVVLAVALLGVGLGGLLAVPLVPRASPAMLALTFAAQAASLVLPPATGNLVAHMALLTQPLGVLGLGAQVAQWTLVTSLVLLVPCVVAGIQFPVLIGMLGRGGHHVGADVGRAYAANTVGSVLGSLAGGFGILPWLGAVGAWRAVGALLALVALALGIMALRDVASRGWVVVSAGLAAWALLACATAEGPGAAWRHAGVGVGRATLPTSRRDLTRWERGQASMVEWEADGLEAGLALRQADGMAFVVNGKVDGHARWDASTQVMLGLLGAVRHGAARNAMVIGLGTGSSTGWLADVAGMEHVDSVELEPRVLDVAARMPEVNRDVLHNPRVRHILGDAREVLRTAPGRYDLVVSEPSNPYRAGIASLFTVEFYRAVKERLNEGGLMVQWLQGYELSGATLRNALATLGTVFPHVEVWHGTPSDFLLVASPRPIPLDTARLARALEDPVVRDGMLRTWRTAGVEGLLSHLVAGPAVVQRLALEDAPFVSTDDRSELEFGFAREVGRDQGAPMDEVEEAARELGARHLEVAPGGPAVDWDLVEEWHAQVPMADGRAPRPWRGPPGPAASRTRALQAAFEGRHAEAITTWASQATPPRLPLATRVLAESAVLARHDAATAALLQSLSTVLPADAAVLEATRSVMALEPTAGRLVDAALAALRREPFVAPPVVRTFFKALEGWHAAPDECGRVATALATPLVAGTGDARRKEVRVVLAARSGHIPSLVAALEDVEPWPPWSLHELMVREEVYRRAGHPLATRARADLEQFIAEGTEPLFAAPPSRGP